MAKKTRKNRKFEERPLSELVESRKNFYQSKMEKAFEMVYKSENFDYIEQFEQYITEISDQAIAGKLEGLLDKTTEAQKKTIRSRIVDNRPRLNLYQYSKARDEGMTNEEIKKKFRMDSPYSIGGFSKHYQANKRNKE
jgi:polyribonucleotide nucleotidyltransferase